MYMLDVAENDNIIETRFFSESDLSYKKSVYVVNRLSKVSKEETKHIIARHRLNNQPQK